MFADLSLECHALKDVIEKSIKKTIKRKRISYLRTQFTMSLLQQCRTLPLSRKVYFITPIPG